MGRRSSIVISLNIALTAVGCGVAPQEPRVIRLKNPSAPTSEDLTADTEESPYGALLNPGGMRECHDKGFVYERLTAKCSESVKLASSYECDRQSILHAFMATGYQIEEVLNVALGRANDQADLGEGFEIDQCGERESGELIVYMVKKEMIDDTPQLRLREIESKP